LAKACFCAAYIADGRVIRDDRFRCGNPHRRVEDPKMNDKNIHDTTGQNDASLTEQELDQVSGGASLTIATLDRSESSAHGAGGGGGAGKVSFSDMSFIAG
jgi:hypothetical protein